MNDEAGSRWSDDTLRRDRARYVDAILDSATEDAIVALNLSGEVTRWNTGAERITGYAATEVMGSSAELIFTPEDRVAGTFEGEMTLAAERGRAPNERWHLRKNGSRFWASGSMLPLLDADGRLEGYLNTFRDQTEAHAEGTRRDLMLEEMGHRGRNLLTLVRSIAVQTARTAPPDGFLAAFDGRLVALARAQDVLGAGDAAGAELHRLLPHTLGFLGTEEGRIALDGPPVHLPARVVPMLGLAVHELATNALKYGALSAAEGRVALSWSVRQEPDGSRLLDLAWQEQGGPPVALPSRKGFGSQLLQRGLAGHTGTTVVLDYARDGVECRIRMPLPAPAATPEPPLLRRNGGPGDQARRTDQEAGARRARRNILWYDRLQAGLEACRQRALDVDDTARATRALMLRLWASDRMEILGRDGALTLVRPA